MKKQLRKLLSALLVLTMLLSALPMGVFAEEDHVPAAVDELTEEGTKELDAEPTIELNEEPAAEPTEEPAVQPTVAPIVDSSDDALENATAGEPETEPEKEPAVEPTVAPIVDSIDDALETATAGERKTEPEKEPAVQPTVAPIVDLTDDALETATAGEPETEPEKEPETTPAAEDEVDEIKPEETPAPAENADDDPLAGLTDKQRKTLSSLPEGFSADVVASAMLRSTGCAHDGELFISHSYTGTSSKIVDNKKHILSVGIAYYYLHCFKCDEIIQEIYRPSTIIIEEEHTWTWAHSYYQPIGSIYDFECQACGATATINPPCSHGKLVKGADLYLHCPDCDVIAWPEIEERTECKHTHYTVDYPNTQQDEYLRWTVDLHLKNTTATVYEEEESNAWGYDAKCNDCGRPILYKDGKINTLYNNYGCGLAYHKNIKSVLEAHSFVNGICEYCGEEQTEEICQHTETKRVENVDKRTTELKPWSDTDHKVTITKYYELHCVKCDAYISSDGSDTTTDNQPHDFGNGDTCVCGYKNVEEICEHIEKEKLEIATKVAYERIDGDLEMHKLIRTQCEGMFCKACGELVSAFDPVVTTSMGKHDWRSSVYNNGVDKCIDCGTTKYENPTKGGYYAALKGLKKGENPLKEGSVVRAIMLSELLKSGFSKTFAEEIITRAAAAPEKYRDIFVYSFFEYENKNDSKSYFGLSENMLHTNPKKGVDTYFHESGHAADAQLFREGKEQGLYTNCTELLETLEKDLRHFLEFTAYESPYKFEEEVPKQLIQNVIDAVINIECGQTKTSKSIFRMYDVDPSKLFSEQEKKVYEKLIASAYDRLKNVPGCNTNMPSDVMTGLTKRILYSHMGHDYVYWEQDPGYMVGTEAWAEWFSSKMYGEDEYVEYNQTYFPKATNVLDEIASEMVEHFREMVRES